MHGYLRSLDTNDWKVFESTMSDNCRAHYNGGKLSFDSHDAVVTFMCESNSGEKVITLHQGHEPERFKR